jgi:hypothetical protein
MPHQELLTETQRLSLQTPASDERGMIRHYTLTSEDLTLINRRRGDPNRLGFAVMLCYLRFPGRILQPGEQPPAALLPLSPNNSVWMRRTLPIMPDAIRPAVSRFHCEV